MPLPAQTPFNSPAIIGGPAGIRAVPPLILSGSGRETKTGLAECLHTKIIVGYVSNGCAEAAVRYAARSDLGALTFADADSVLAAVIDRCARAQQIGRGLKEACPLYTLVGVMASVIGDIVRNDN
jgi:hypothetical protein